MPPLLVVRGLCKAYVAGYGRCWAHVQVLSSLSFSIYRGERVVIAGARGAGKTTLLHCLTGLRRPDAGTVRWDASAGVPYQLCSVARDLEYRARHSAVLVEMPDDNRDAATWFDALHPRRTPDITWIVFTSRPGPLVPFAHRVLTLRDGALRPVVPEQGMRVAEAR